MGGRTAPILKAAITMSMSLVPSSLEPSSKLCGALTLGRRHQRATRLVYGFFGQGSFGDEELPLYVDGAFLRDSPQRRSWAAPFLRT